MTQEQLAAALGISYQRIQKYETGANRVSARRLFEIGQRLGVDVAHFFEGVDPTAAAKGLPHGGRNRVAIDLVRNFLEIANEERRSALANLVKTLKADASTPTPVPYAAHRPMAGRRSPGAGALSPSAATSGTDRA
jgi:transcriptional regulator with XRE-family HTH domain